MTINIKKKRKKDRQWFLNGHINIDYITINKIPTKKFHTFFP